jgi:SagB-type dehydrogenase family enzyme
LQFNWALSTGPSLYERHEESLAEFYHENSKLFPVLAERLAADFAVTPFEAYLMSRSFRQYRNAPRTLLPEIESANESLQEVMLRRRSSHSLEKEISFSELATLLGQSLGPTAMVENPELGVTQFLRAWPSAGGLYPLDAYVVVSKVEDLSQGLYFYNPISNELERLPSRDVEMILAEGFFWQDFVTQAAVVILLVAAFERTMAKYGQRGYRLVLLDAGHAAQNIVLTAEQLRLGAVPVGGFFDDGLAADLKIDSVSEAVVHTIAIGRRA